MAFLFSSLVFITNTTVCFMCLLHGDAAMAILTLIGALVSGGGLCSAVKRPDTL